MKKMIFFVVVLLFCFLQGQEKEKDILSTYDEKNLTNIAYKALKTGNLKTIEKLVMDEDKYAALPGTKERLAGKSQEEIQEMLTAVSLRAKQKLKTSFHVIRKIMDKLKFDWKNAKVIAVYVEKPRENLKETAWIDYQVTDKRVRLDINYTIESMGNYVRIKLDDTFLIEGKRYLGSGYRLLSYKAKEPTNEIKNLIIRYHLNGGFIHIPEK
ncbi:hypothetical protein [Candidatus Uabimicrobium amorphum]|uniref:Uncharacterized protein n=1 Tax=Uabimicrobium amorphum TaxID=2596890 RepID=A0A5S9ISF2_UABAM|nr:hypothetical protein [Candidatus Uabimicrobium amorphum]BBM87293.1 hypothetical protein UABAM_05699 [Candidatus Uabimicrobium amorphum]